MFFKAFNNCGDTETGVMKVTDHLSPSVRTLFGDFTENAFCHTKETLLALVPLLKDDENYYNLGMVLYYLQRRCKHAEYKRMLEENEISPRTASYLAAIFQKFSTLKIPCPIEIPWRTLGEAIVIMNHINYKEIIQLCREKSKDQMIQYIREGGK